MKYHAPYGSTDPDASYVDKDVPGAVRGSAVPALAIEDPQREIVDFLVKSGIDPADGRQLASAVQTGKVNFAVAAGTANAITATLSPAPDSLVDGFPVRLRATSTNSGAVTLNLNGTGVLPITSVGGTALQAGQIAGGGIYNLVYSSTLNSWALTSQSAGQFAVPAANVPNAAVNLGQFVSSLSLTSNYVLVPSANSPSGVWVVQTGRVVTVVGGDTTVTYPFAFPTAASSVVGSVGDAASDFIAFVTNGTTTTSFKCSAISAGGRNARSCSWLAFGY